MHRGTRPRVVGQLSELINECPEKTYEGWKKWYLSKYPEAIENATVKIDEMVESCPFFFWGATFQIAESHQASKVGVSGTARAFQEQLERHGAVMSEEIISIRDPERQRKLGVPDKFLEGHGYHFVTVCDANGKIIHHFETKVHGRSSYVETALMDVEFLDEQRRADVRGRVFSQADVLRNLGRVA